MYQEVSHLCRHGLASFITSRAKLGAYVDCLLEHRQINQRHLASCWSAFSLRTLELSFETIILGERKDKMKTCHLTSDADSVSKGQCFSFVAPSPGTE